MDNTNDPMEIPSIIKGYYEQLYAENFVKKWTKSLKEKNRPIPSKTQFVKTHT